MKPNPEAVDVPSAATAVVDGVLQATPSMASVLPVDAGQFAKCCIDAGADDVRLELPGATSFFPSGVENAIDVGLQNPSTTNVLNLRRSSTRMQRRRACAATQRLRRLDPRPWRRRAGGRACTATSGVRGRRCGNRAFGSSPRWQRATNWHLRTAQRRCVGARVTCRGFTATLPPPHVAAAAARRGARGGVKQV